MRIRLALPILAFIAVALIPSVPAADPPEKNEGELLYDIKLDEKKPARIIDEHPDTHEWGTFVCIDFSINPRDPKMGYDANHWYRILEDGKVVLEAPLKQQGDLTIILALDTNANMRLEKLTQAKDAGDVFLNVLHEKADTGLILFNQTVYERIRPLGNHDEVKQKEHREKIRAAKNKAQSGGLPGYRNATIEAINDLKDVKGNKAVVVITDGIDRESQNDLNAVIAAAKKQNVQVYTISVGSPDSGRSAIFVLDHSGSMSQPANDRETKTKIQGLHESACECIDRIRAGVKMTILPFSSKVEPCPAFTEDKETLKNRIRALQPVGGTLLYDSIYTAIGTLAATYPENQRVVIVMTDGVDEEPGSRHRYEEVIEFAKQEKVVLNLVGLGREHEINKPVMEAMAKATGGVFVHADDTKKLNAFFEEQSKELSHEGVDVAELQRLAKETGGTYNPAEDTSKLADAIKRATSDADKDYHPIFKSNRPNHDGTVRGIDIVVFDKRNKDKVLSNKVTTAVQVHGVVPPGVDWRWYLLLLGALAALLVVPPSFRTVARVGGK